MKINKSVFSKKRHSIAFSWTSAILVIIFTQSILLSGILLFGGVLSQTTENAYQSFSEKTEERKNYLQGEMINRFANIDIYAEQISNKLSLLGTADALTEENIDAFFNEASPALISMLRSSAATDAFVILDDNNNKNTHSAIYFRDYDPLLDNNQNSDLRLMIGPTKIAEINKTMIGDSWKYSLVLDDNNKDFYQKPYENAHLSNNAKLISYWSKPFRLNTNGEPAITYSRPLFDNNGKLRGVIGIGLTMQYLNTFLPATALKGENNLGYVLGTKSAESNKITPLFASNSLQASILNFEESFDISGYDEKTGIGKLRNHNAQQQIYACIKKLEIYENNTPFEKEEWYLLGLAEENYLLAFTNKISQLLLISFLISIPLGAIYGIFVGNRLTKPIISLVEKIRNSELSESLSFEKTGFAEIDELAEVIESANKTLMQQRDYDDLTKLCTNQLFKKEVTKLLKSGSETLGTSAMLMIDLDDFKKVNDTYGHQWGDSYLKAFAQMMLQTYMSNAVVGRRSGDEFHVFLYGDKSQTEALKRLCNLYARLKETQLTRPDGSHTTISISTGLIWCDENMNCDELLFHADKALYEAKKNNKGFFTIGFIK